jgi:hypothetical protein
VRKVDMAAGTAPSTPLFVRTRQKECRRVAKVCPEYLKESYLEMAAEYEQLANETKKSA